MQLKIMAAVSARSQIQIQISIHFRTIVVGTIYFNYFQTIKI